MEIIQAQKYMSERKRMLKEMLVLTLQEETLKKKIKKLKREMFNWDKILLQWKDGDN